MSSTNHDQEKEALEDAANRVLAGVGKIAFTQKGAWVTNDGGTVTPPSYAATFTPAAAQQPPPVSPPPPPVVNAKFTASVDGDTVTIHDATTGAESESIDYGDGSVDDTLPLGPYTYHASGTYTIRLMAAGADGSTSIATQTVNVVVASDPPVEPPPVDGLAGKTALIEGSVEGNAVNLTLNPGDRKRLVPDTLLGSIWYSKDGLSLWMQNRHAGLAGDVTGHFKITVADTVVFDGDLTLFAYRAPRPFWLSEPKVRPDADLQWFNPYGKGSEGASMYDQYMKSANGPNGMGIGILGIGTTGERAPLGGRLAQYDADYVVNPSAKNAIVVRRMSDACSPYVMAAVDPATEDWLDPIKYPTASFELVGDKYPTNPIKPFKTASKYNMNGALTHATNYCSLACEVFGTDYDRDMLAGWSIYVNSLQANNTYCSKLHCATYTDAVGRAKARGLNIMLYCTRYAPDQWKPLFDSWVREFAQLGVQEWLNQPGIHCDQKSGGYYGGEGWAPWQDKLLVPEFGLGIKMGYGPDGFQQILDYFAVCLKEMMNIGPAGTGAQHEFGFIYDSILFRHPYADEIAPTTAPAAAICDYNDTLSNHYYKPWHDALHAYVKTLDVDQLTRRILYQAVDIASKGVWDAKKAEDNAAFRAGFSAAIAQTYVPVSNWADSLKCLALRQKTLAAALQCEEGSPALQTAWQNKYPGGQPGDYNGYPTSPTGYPAMGYGAYAAIAEYGTDPLCKVAYEKFKKYLRVNWKDNPKYHEVMDTE